ncbi:hypothetical protein ebA5608 [Aromatoleum aromaticum EbN1]|uniref:Uncharacterized protein n=1 Tax=Aromatoleum aromaticum (strain DSM 19018 / LMG 30748 / EbN1) TaxID=76114 RepID=Q5P046_AROAE|nr:hypothetical protein ebA5608 [Aromatoleum aromaticum EbN1]
MLGSIRAASLRSLPVGGREARPPPYRKHAIEQVIDGAPIRFRPGQRPLQEADDREAQARPVTTLGRIDMSAQKDIPDGQRRRHRDGE